MNEISSASWSETDASNNSPTPNGWPEGQSPSSVNDCARMMMGAVKRFWDRINGRYASTGSANAYVMTPDVALGSYVLGERYSFRASFANSGPATLNISALGAVAIKKMTPAGKADVAPGDIQGAQPVTVEYDGTHLVLVTPIAQTSAGGFELISTSTPSGASEVNLTGFDPARYIDYQIVVDALAPSTDDVDLYLLTSTNGGSSYDTGAGDYSWIVHRGGGASGNVVYEGDDTDAQMKMHGTEGVGNGSQEHVSCTIDLFNPAATSNSELNWRGSFRTAAASLINFTGSGTRLSSADVNAVKLRFSSGNMSGTIRFYGRRK